MKYADLLKDNGVKPEETTKKIQKLIKELQGVEQAIPMAKEQLKDSGLSSMKRKKLQTDLKAAEAALPEMDQALYDAIEAWLPRRQEFAKKAEHLRAGKAAKQGAPATAASNAAPAEPPKNATGTATAGKPAATAGSNHNGGNSQQGSDDKKKGGFSWGWIFGGVVILVGAIVGVNMANKAK